MPQTLYQYLKSRLFSEPNETSFRKTETTKPEKFGPHKLSINDDIRLNEIDIKNISFNVSCIKNYSRVIADKSFDFYDYVLTPNKNLTSENDDFKLTLRSSDAASILLKLEDEMEFSEDFLNVVTDKTNIFRIDNEDGTPVLEFKRVDDLTDPFIATVTKIDSDGTRKERVKYWDFVRTSQDEANQPFDEYVFVEIDEKTGWTTILRGREINPANVIS